MNLLHDKLEYSLRYWGEYSSRKLLVSGSTNPNLTTNQLTIIRHSVLKCTKIVIVIFVIIKISMLIIIISIKGNVWQNLKEYRTQRQSQCCLYAGVLWDGSQRRWLHVPKPEMHGVCDERRGTAHVHRQNQFPDESPTFRLHSTLRHSQTNAAVPVRSVKLRHKQTDKKSTSRHLRLSVCPSVFYFVSLSDSLSVVSVRGVHRTGGRGAMLHRNLMGIKIWDQPIDTRTWGS